MIRKEPGFLCTPAVSREQVQDAETDTLIRKLFQGSRKAFLSTFLQEGKLTDDEVAGLPAAPVSPGSAISGGSGMGVCGNPPDHSICILKQFQPIVIGGPYGEKAGATSRKCWIGKRFVLFFAMLGVSFLSNPRMPPKPSAGGLPVVEVMNALSGMHNNNGNGIFVVHFSGWTAYTGMGSDAILAADAAGLSKSYHEGGLRNEKGDQCMDHPGNHFI